MNKTAKNYLGLILVIILWVSVWFLIDTIAILLFLTPINKLFIVISIIVIVSILLVKFYPNDLL